ncbi:1-deoxy-D-xylulose-5-phosphate synthase N-terminal domain-containing protein [Streptomyces sp. NPDC017529]|uniref:1-deoxy-D-xylulose-5-phosphate synthase N-terminal domain-containing protein n=1 Tax=Streptomyces sp. NPDC017529 TaxID=3365000 RepID=UPI0037B36935
MWWTHLADHQATLRKNGDAAGSNLFTSLGVVYLGPLDGHDTAPIEAALHRARALRRPVAVHVVTTTGKGHLTAEHAEADCLHAVGPTARPPGAHQPEDSSQTTTPFSTRTRWYSAVHLCAAMVGSTTIIC